MNITLPTLWHRPQATAESLLLALASASFIAVALLGGWLLAGVLWGFSSTSPAPATRLENRPLAVAEALASRPLFSSGTAVATVDVETGWQLLGVLAASDKTAARAILRRDGEMTTLVLAVGDEAAGARLSQITGDGVTLVAGGRESRLGLPRPGDLSLTEPPVDD